jgi:hypothetical protein
MPKQNKLGIHKTIEEYVLNILTFLIDSALEDRQNKLETLNKARRYIEISKHLIRLEYELSIIKEKQYIILAQMLENISMMTTGWTKFLKTQNPPEGRI